MRLDRDGEEAYVDIWVVENRSKEMLQETSRRESCGVGVGVGVVWCVGDWSEAGMTTNLQGFTLARLSSPLRLVLRR